MFVHVDTADLDGRFSEAVTAANESFALVEQKLNVLVVVVSAATDCRNLIEDQYFVLQFSDITGSVGELQIPNFLRPPAESTVRTLKVIVEEGDGVSLAMIVDILGIAKSTVARHVTELEEREFVRSEMDGKTKVVYPTDQGRLAVDIDAL